MEKICKSCSSPFDISSADMQFYEKISPMLGKKKYLIPPPTICPECRQQYLLVFRNDRNLYHHKCAATGKEMISMYPSEADMVVYEKNTWWGDSWDGTDYGQEYDFSRPFFAQFSELMRRVPHPSLNVLQNENSDYVNYTGWNKNCYLCFAGNSLEDSLYCYNTENSRNCVDCLDLLECESCYECIQCNSSHSLFFSLHCKNCSDSAFLEDCQGCAHCFLCWNLRNKKYCILNKQYSKEEYEIEVQKLQMSCFSGLHKTRQIFEEERLKYPKKSLHNILTENCTGEYIVQSKNCHDCYAMHKNCEDSQRILVGFPGLKDSQDCAFAGENSALLYAGVCIGDRCQCCAFGHTIISGSHGVYYSDCTINCQYCFGCSALRNQQYCILNKQYSKEAYEKLLSQIIAHMQETGEWGEFFPIEVSPFAYNETVAQEYFPLKKEAVVKKNWQWREPEEPDFSEVSKKIPAEKLPAAIQDIPDDILHWAIECAASKRLFKIQKSELEFYRKMNLPIPHLHPDIRHRKRMQLRNPRKLWVRNCAKCHKEIHTSYAPERPEVVYCEECYLQTVY